MGPEQAAGVETHLVKASPVEVQWLAATALVAQALVGASAAVAGLVAALA